MRAINVVSRLFTISQKKKKKKEEEEEEAIVKPSGPTLCHHPC